MLLPLFHSHSSLLLPKPQTDQSNPPFLFLFASLPLPKTSISQNPKPSKFLIRCSTSTTTTTETLPKSAIQRIADKLRSLGYTDENPGNKPEPRTGHGHGSAGEIFVPLPQKLPKYRVGSTIDPSWSTPDNPVPEPGSGSAISRYHELRNVVESEERLARKKEKEKEERVPTLAELSLKEGELRRLRGIGIKLKKKVKIGKAGITEGIVNGIHERWRRAEVVKLVCEDLCKLNMKRTHDLLERKTGGLVVWRSGSNIILYRGANYKYPYFLADNNSTTDNSHDTSMNSGMDSARYGSQGSYLSSTDNIISAGTDQSNKRAQSSLIQGVGSPNRVRFQLPGEAQLAEEADSLLDGLGPRFTDWWGYDPLPVDADLLPALVPGYRRPFRLLPYGVKPKLTDDEMTILRRLGRPLPCHFSLGRNRNLKGLAASIIKLWEKCEIAKIAIKRGVQNTNSDLMAEELKRLTGGTLLSRDSEFIVFYRGKDFLPSAVSSAIEERRKYGMHMDKSRMDSSVSVMTTDGPELRSTQHASEDILDGTNNQTENFLSEQRKLGTIEAGIKRTQTKLSMALEKKEEAEKLLAELGKAEMPQQLETDKEGITEEERHMLRKVGLRMKPFLLLGRRGVFAGTIENMHLHWKYRELVKILCQERRIEDVHGVARTLEAESGGILVAIERVSKGYAVIVYRGKNYTRPASLRPNTLLNKREAMKRSLEAQRRQSLKLHVLKLTRNIEDLKLQMVKDKEGSSTQSVDASTIQLVEERLGADSTTRNSNYGVDVSVDCLELNHQDKQIDFSSRCEDETVKAEPASSSKAIPLETEVFTHMNNDSGNVDSTSSPDNSLSPVRTTCSTSAIVNTVPRILDITMESSVTSTGGKLESSTHGVVEDGSNGVNPRAVRLSNRERLLLRKQALKMKKRPVLAVGRSNIVTGVAKTIKAHFLKHPLAIVNVKGRAKGTSVQEVIYKLEQATGAVLVSQEPSKVILYRGWGAGEERDHSDKKNLRKTSEARGGLSQAAVCPELMAAIKLECGLQTNQEEEATL